MFWESVFVVIACRNTEQQHCACMKVTSFALKLIDETNYYADEFAKVS